MMKVALIVYENQDGFDSRTDPDRAPAYWASYQAFSQTLLEAGVMLPGGFPLEVPQQGATIKVRHGKTQVQDGPYPDAKELLGGVFLLEVPTLEEAAKWAALCPAAQYATVEVRPLLALPTLQPKP